MEKKYLFTSERLGFRDWHDDDLEPMAALNADSKVMEFFPSTQSKEQTKAFIERMKAHQKEKGYCYFAVDELSSHQFIGFIGLAYQEYHSPYSPFVDIGYRLAQAFWNKGYATEGSQRCLEWAKKQLQLKDIYSVAILQNKKSMHVMKKLGLSKLGEFDHPGLKDYPAIQRCAIYHLALDHLSFK